MSYSISSIYKSLVRHIMDAVRKIQEDGVSTDLAYFAFDSRGEDAELDNTDLVGLAGWSFHENGGLWQIRCGINISTIFDENLFREVALVDALHDWFGEDCVIPLRDPDTGEVYTELVVRDFEMMPALASEKRNFRPIGLELLRTAPGG